jgi:hypothetical protein
MNRSSRRLVVALLILLPAVGLSAIWNSQARSQTQNQAQDPIAAASQKRAVFMRQKLDHAKNILEGLTRDNLPAVAAAAGKLRLLSQAAEWEVPTIPDVEQYVPLTTEFQKYCDDLRKAAQAKDIDGATQAYVQLTVNCVKCHKYLRGAPH